MAKEPQVTIIQVTSEQQLQEARAAEAGIVNPEVSPGSSPEDLLVGKFMVKSENGRSYQDFLTADGDHLICNLL